MMRVLHISDCGKGGIKNHVQCLRRCLPEGVVHYTIGEVNGKAPQIGDNVYISPGAKLFGDIVIGDNVKIGANAVVNKSFPEGNCTLVGVPARKV